MRGFDFWFLCLLVIFTVWIDPRVYSDGDCTSCKQCWHCGAAEACLSGARFFFLRVFSLPPTMSDCAPRLALSSDFAAFPCSSCLLLCALRFAAYIDHIVHVVTQGIWSTPTTKSGIVCHRCCPTVRWLCSGLWQKSSVINKWRRWLYTQSAALFIDHTRFSPMTNANSPLQTNTCIDGDRYMTMRSAGPLTSKRSGSLGTVSIDPDRYDTIRYL